MSRPDRALLALAVALALGACADELPDGPVGFAALSGHVRYDGSAHAAMREPILEIALFAFFPPHAGLPPHGALTVEDPRFDDPEGLAYRLPLVTPGTYYLVGGLRDRAAESTAMVAAGSFPNACALDAAQGSVIALADEALEGVDVALYDAGGAANPCHAAPLSPCPEPDRASLVLQLAATGPLDAIAPADALTVALFTEWPAQGPPATYSVTPGDAAALPTEIVLPSVPPGELSVYACLDRGADALTSTCGEDDAWAVYAGGERVAFAAGEVTTMALDLTTGEGAIEGVVSAVEAGCEEQGGGGGGTGPGSLTVTVTATDLAPAAGDRLSVALFEDYPAAGPPAYYGFEEPSALPAVVALTDIEPGPYHVSVCFDVGGDSLFCDGPGDVSVAVGDGVPVDVPAGEDVAIEVALN